MEGENRRICAGGAEPTRIKGEVRMKRSVIAALLALAMFITILPGCQHAANTAAQAGASYVAAWKKRDYAAMYAMLTEGAQEQIAKKDFVTKYENILDDLALETAIKPGTVEEANGRYYLPVSVTYSKEELGEIPVDLRVPLVKESGEWRVDWSPALIFPQMNWGDSLRFVRLTPQRGEIFAGSGEVIAKNGYLPTVYVERDLVQDEAATISELADLTGMTEKEVQKLYNSKSAQKSGVAVIKAFPLDEEPEDLDERADAIPGVGVDRQIYTPNREYPYGSLLAHVLGYAQPTTDELKQASKTPVYGNFVGVSGLEAKYDEVMQGTLGAELSVVDEDGKKVASIAKVPAVNGKDIHLTIDLELQQRLETLLKAAYGSENSGAGVVMDPTTGAVQAIASYPAFDLNAFVTGVSDAEWEALNDDGANRPLFNRALQGLYPPGSSFKPFTAILGIDEGIVNGSFVFPQTVTNNAWVPQGIKWYWPSIKRHASYEGAMTLYNSMVHSDNIFYAYIALQAGEEKLKDFTEKIKLNEAVPFNLPTAQGQLLSKPEEGFESPRILADSGYGQGEVLMTPLQVAASYGIFANDGFAYEPYIVAAYYEDVEGEYRATETFSADLWLENMVSQEARNLIIPALEGVIKEGTGTSVQVKDMTIAGKTGTAELNYDKSRSIAWFAGFVREGPYDRLVCIMEESPAEVNYQRTAIAREMFRPSEKYQGEEEPQQPTESDPAGDPTTQPSSEPTQAPTSEPTSQPTDTPSQSPQTGEPGEE